MKSLSSLGLALSVVFTCLLFALIAEIYYLLWWKKRIIRSNQSNYLYMFCCKNKSSPVNSINAPHQSPNNKDYLVKPLDDDDDDYEYEYECGVLEAGLISGPPRFLFTIKEETKEDLLESELDNGKVRSSLSELLVKTIETPYTTPLSSPPFLTPLGSCHSGNSGGCNYNPFYEATSDAEFSRMVKASPPPKFKFLRDAEEKLKRRTMLGEGGEEGQDGNFIAVVVA